MMTARCLAALAALMLAAPASTEAAAQFPPNSGTAPDWLGICMGTATHRLHARYDAVRLGTPRFPSGGLRIVDGQANGRRFRCTVDGRDRLRAFTLLGRGR